MVKRFISVCSVVIWLFGLYGCAQTVEGTTVAETEAVSEEETTDAAEQEKQAAGSPAPPVVIITKFLRRH